MLLIGKSWRPQGSPGTADTLELRGTPASPDIPEVASQGIPELAHQDTQDLADIPVYRGIQDTVQFQGIQDTVQFQGIQDTVRCRVFPDTLGMEGRAIADPESRAIRVLESADILGIAD
jgi:hypothetical protein